MPARDFAAVYERLKPWLPAHATDILDIGCGYAEIDVFLAKHYLDMGREITIHLLDGDESDMENRHKRALYASHPQPWRSRFFGVNTLRSSGLDCAIRDYPADPTLTIPCDLIISTRSWGHHYPIGVYIDLADRSLRKGGRIITDLRLRAGVGINRELALLESRGFTVISKNIELHSGKCKRFVFER